MFVSSLRIKLHPPRFHVHRDYLYLLVDYTLWVQHVSSLFTGSVSNSTETDLHGCSKAAHCASDTVCVPAVFRGTEAASV